MKKRILTVILSIMLTAVLILSSCSQGDPNDPSKNKEKLDTPEPELIIKGKNGFGMFKLTVTDRVTGIATLEFTDTLQGEELPKVPEGVEVKRMYSVTLTLKDVESKLFSSTNKTTFDKYVLSVSGGYQMLSRLIFTGVNARAFLKEEKQRLDTALENGEITKQMHKRSVAILDGEYSLYDTGSVLEAEIKVYDDGSAYLYKLVQDGDGDGKYELSVSTDISDKITVIKQSDKSFSYTFTVSLGGFLRSEARDRVTDSGIIPDFQKQYGSEGDLTRLTEYHENGRIERTTDYAEKERPSAVSEYNDKGILTRKTEYYPSGNVKKETHYYESGSVKYLLEYADTEGSTPSRTDYLEGSSKPVPVGETVDIGEFIEDHGGFYMGGGSVVISVCEGMPFISVRRGDVENGVHFIGDITLCDGYYHVGVKNGSEGSVCDYIVLKINGNVLKVKDSEGTYILDPDREYLGEKPTGLTELPITELDKFLGTWTDYFYQGRHMHFAKNDVGYVYTSGILESCGFRISLIDGLYFDGVNKYTVVVHTETEYDSMDDRISVGSIRSIEFYDAPDGKNPLISTEGYSGGFELFERDPLIQLDEEFKTSDICFKENPEVVDVHEFAIIFSGVWTGKDDSIGIDIVDGKPWLLHVNADGSTDIYYISDVYFYDKRNEFIVTLKNGHYPTLVGAVKYQISPDAAFNEITLYANGEAKQYRFDKTKTYPYELHSDLKSGVKITADNLDVLLGTWSEAVERRHMLHIYKEGGKYRIILGRHGEYYTDGFEIVEVRLDNHKWYLHCLFPERTDGRGITRESHIFTIELQYHKNDHDGSYSEIGQLYDHLDLCIDGSAIRYYKDPNLTYPLKDEFPYSETVLNRVTSEQLYAAIGGDYATVFGSGSIKIELKDGNALFTFDNVKNLHGEFSLLEAYESYYYKTYKLILSNADGKTAELYLRPGFLYGWIALLDTIDSDIGSINYYKR